jgi:hypothetical protein
MQLERERSARKVAVEAVKIVAAVFGWGGVAALRAGHGWLAGAGRSASGGAKIDGKWSLAGNQPGRGFPSTGTPEAGSIGPWVEARPDFR